MTSQPRILHFSPTRSAGVLSVLPPGETHWVRLAEARWSVLVPDGMPVSLHRSPEATDDYLAPLRDLEPDALDELLLLGRPITDLGLARLGGLTGLRLLDLFRTAVTDAGMPTLRGFTCLEWLSLTGCRVGDAGVAALAGLPRLRRLSLKATHVTDAVAATLATLPALEWLSLTGCRVGDGIVPGLAALPSLRAVSLDGTGVSPVGQAELVLRRPDLAVIGH